MNKPIVAAFDFDGTLSSGESGLRFIRYLLGDMRFFLFAACCFPLLIAYRLHIYDEKILANMVRWLFKNRDVQATKKSAHKYACEVIPKYIKPEVERKLLWHQKEGHRCVILSRSFTIYLKPWAESLGVLDVLATELEDDGPIYTGNMIGESCAREVKVARLEALLGPRDHYYLYAYADSSTDKPMIEIADRGIWIR